MQKAKDYIIQENHQESIYREENAGQLNVNLQQLSCQESENKCEHMKKQKTTTITKSFYLFIYFGKNSKKKLGFVVEKKISKSERKKERKREEGKREVE